MNSPKRPWKTVTKELLDLTNRLVKIVERVERSLDGLTLMVTKLEKEHRVMFIRLDRLETQIEALKGDQQ